MKYIISPAMLKYRAEQESELKQARHARIREISDVIALFIFILALAVLAWVISGQTPPWL